MAASHEAAVQRALPSISCVVPCYNEADNLENLLPLLSARLASLAPQWEIVLVDDGSTDATGERMDRWIRQPGVHALQLSRNFGKEAALTAGLDQVDADLALVIDADLQDPPELIPEFIAKWREGCDVVYGQRLARDGETWLKRATASAFYRVMQRLSATPIPPDTGDFRLMSRRVVDALRGLRERQRFMKGIFAWVGFRQCALPYRRDPREAGSSKFNYWKLWNFALDGLMSFSSWPLRVWSYVGVGVSLIAFLYILKIITQVLFFGIDVPGYASLMSVMLFLGGIQLLSLGIIGEYIGRMFVEVKQRPVYLIEGVYGQYARPDADKPQAADGQQNDQEPTPQ